VKRFKGQKARRSSRGLTLIEVVIGVAIAALAAGIAVGAINSLTNAALRSTAIELTGAIKFSYDRAIMERRTQRLSLDLDKGQWWIDFTQEPFSIAAEKERGREGGRPEEDEQDPRRRGRSSLFDDDEEKKEIKRVLEGGKAASFTPDEEAGGLRPLPSDVEITKVWTGHQIEAFTSGIAHVHFFSGGWTEPALIELTDGDEIVTLEIYPLTGRVRTHPRAIEVPGNEDVDGRDEGDL
jgi:prepilin-type N-terminal cleavage/methylation domain-containing protein